MEAIDSILADLVNTDDLQDLNMSQELDLNSQSPSVAPQSPGIPLESQLQPSQQKSVHLVTWSRADPKLLLTRDHHHRQSFGKLLTRLFNKKSPNVVEYWACAREPHERGGIHFHVAIKFSRKTRWSTVASELRAMKIFVNFQAFHTTYKDAFEYVTKRDKQYVTSNSHPKMLVTPPKSMATKRSLPFTEDDSFTTLCSPPFCSTPDTSLISSGSASSQIQPSGSTASATATARPKKTKIPRLNNVQVSQIITEHDIKDDLRLCALANTFMQNGQPELANWVANHPAEKYRNDLIKTSWKMSQAGEELAQQNMTRIQKLESHLNADHASDEENGTVCAGRWRVAAMEILSANGIEIGRWQELMSKCLRFGRNKKNNIFLVGERNCGKSFLLRPLTIIYDTFCNPATGSFNWVGAHAKEVILLNDFRYPPIDKGAEKLIAWQDLLNLCDVDKLNIQAPKSFYAENIEWTAKQPILGNGPREVKYIKGGFEDRSETAQMDARMQYIHLNTPIAEERLDTSILPCARCFAHLVLNGIDMM